jgi:antirestriction protein ArdC
MSMASKTWKKSSESSVDRYSDYVENYARTLATLIEENRAPWQRPVAPGTVEGGMPYNATSGKGYTGSNVLYLSMAQAINGYADDRWLTFKQAQDLGANVRKGEKGTQLVKWIEVGNKRKREGEGGDAADDKKRLAPVLFTVFNAEQCDGLAPATQRAQIPEHERHAQCEKLLKDSGAEIVQGGVKAFYVPAFDRIHVPKPETCRSMDAFYATNLHELGHWSGHKSRLDRDLSGQFGSESYAREELNAEIFSFMVGQRLQIGHDPSQHAAYLQSWIKIVRDDPKAILVACRQAEKMCDFLGVAKYEHEATQKLEKTQEQANTRTAARDDDRVVPMPAPKAVAARDRAADQDYGMAM